MPHSRFCLLFAALLLQPFAAWPGQTPAPADAELYFIAPADGDRIKSPVRVVMGLRNMGIAPAGVVKGNTGHHHLIIDALLPDLDSPVPNDDRHRHFGGGQTEAIIELPPGRHSLQLLLGDFAHIPHSPPIHSKRITIIVEE